MWRRSTPSRVVSLDLETTGLDVERARMLSVGMVPVVDDTIVLGHAFTSLVRTGTEAEVSAGHASAERTTGRGTGGRAARRGTGGRATERGAGGRATAGLLGMEAHHLRPTDVAEAPTLGDTVRAILAQLREADALLVHHAPLDVGVLRRSCVEVGEMWPRIAVIDTLRLIRRANRRGALIGTPAIPTDLGGARASFGLPRHAAHDPLADAVATAELYLALRHRSR